MRPLLRSAALVLSCLAAPVTAKAEPVVVELYTSQGCSSCPPADEMLAQLAERDDVIALALHVDYWDYIGWADEFADPEHTRRQQDYARAAGQTAIYTPQFVIGGRDIVVGARGMQVADRIQEHKATTQPVSVTLQRSGDLVTITAQMTGQSNIAGPYVVQLAQVSPRKTVEITRGENAGKTIAYSSIVRSLEVLDQWTGEAELRLEAQVNAERQVAVIVQHGSDGVILGAAKLD